MTRPSATDSRAPVVAYPQVDPHDFFAHGMAEDDRTKPRWIQDSQRREAPVPRAPAQFVEMPSVPATKTPRLSPRSRRPTEYVADQDRRLTSSRPSPTRVDASHYDPLDIRRKLLGDGIEPIAESTASDEEDLAAPAAGVPTIAPPQPLASRDDDVTDVPQATTSDEVLTEPVDADFAAETATVADDIVATEADGAMVSDVADSISPVEPPTTQRRTVVVDAPPAAARVDDASDDIAKTFGNDGQTARIDDQPRASSAQSSRAAKAFASDEPMPINSAKRQAATSSHQSSAVPTTENVLVSQQMPLISSRVLGPRQILIGRPSTYQIELTNESHLAAKDVVATVNIPAWADVVGSVTSIGVIQRSIDAQQPNDLQWQIAELSANQSETLRLKLVPRSSNPLELGVSWTSAPIGSRAIVEVQEPMLKMSVAGPVEVLYGKPQSYRLSLSNPGTGLAENVVINLYPPGGGSDKVSSHTIGNLPAGESKSVEVELTAREVGKLAIRAEASAAGGIMTKVLREVVVRKPELQIDWRGPESRYSGTPATFYLRVRNPGTAPAEGVVAEAELPDGAEFVSASGAEEFDESTRLLRWEIGALAPGEENFMEVKCVVHQAGTNSMRLVARTADGQLEDAQVLQTHVIALADLKLEVSDPTGPVEIKDTAVYEIRISNRGTNAARSVNVVAMFSEGVEPFHVEGAQYSVHDGRVAFQTIDSLPAGRDVVLRIQARGNKPGTHIFRAEVICSDLDTKLTSEEATRYYVDESPSESAYSANREGAFESSRR